MPEEVERYLQCELAKGEVALSRISYRTVEPNRQS